MSVHIEVTLDKNTNNNKYIIIIYANFPHRTMNNQFDNISDNISIRQNISYIVVSF